MYRKRDLLSQCEHKRISQNKVLSVISRLLGGGRGDDDFVYIYIVRISHTRRPKRNADLWRWLIYSRMCRTNKDGKTYQRNTGHY